MPDLLSGKTEIDRLRLQKKYGTEQVFAVPYSLTENIPDRFTPIKDIENKGIFLDTDRGKYILRCDAEEDMSFQQIIPCAIITDTKGRYYVSRRIKGDNRLQDAYSITFGGHINPVDGYMHPIEKCLSRELFEETTISDIPAYEREKLGYIRDLGSTTPDHIGVLFQAIIPEEHSATIKIRETDSLEGSWMTKKQLFMNFYRFESWAQIIIENIIDRKNDHG